MTTTLDEVNEVAYVGATSILNAEYAVQCDSEFCVALFICGEPVSVEGAQTESQLMNIAAQYECRKEYFLY